MRLLPYFQSHLPQHLHHLDYHPAAQQMTEQPSVLWEIVQQPPRPDEQPGLNSEGLEVEPARTCDVKIFLLTNVLKGIVQPKMIIDLESTQAIQDEFVFSWERIWRNVALHLLLTNGSEVNGCHHHKNITTLHTTKVHK